MIDACNVLGWVSCGVTSAVANKLAIEKYGKDNIDLWYIHIDTAHKDNARFIRDSEKWYDCHINTTKSKKYKDQFDVIERERYINGPGGAHCTKVLKREVRLRLQRLYKNVPQIFGFEFSITQINRAVRFLQQYPDANAEFPLIEAQLTKSQCADIILMNGIKLPKMYRLGYNNNNCIGCVKGGRGYWNKIRVDFPEVFAEMAIAEREIGRSCIKGVFLDELLPEAGIRPEQLMPDCGDFCEIKFVDIIDPLTLEIYNKRKTLADLI